MQAFASVRTSKSRVVAARNPDFFVSAIASTSQIADQALSVNAMWCTKICAPPPPLPPAFSDPFGHCLDLVGATTFRWQNPCVP
jgi:hypothetical protein